MGGNGGRGTVTVQNLRDTDGTLMANGNKITLSLMNQVQNLDEAVIFPNPAKVKQHSELYVGNVPLGTEMKIITINGELLYHTIELSGAGSIKINIKKELPDLTTGVYIVVLSRKGSQKVQKLFFIK